MSDTANGFLSLNQDITYSAPQPVADGEISYTSFKPQTIGAYTPNQTIEFKLRSSNEFVILDRSYMKFKFIETGAITVNTAGTSLTSMGGQAFISQVSDTISGLQLPLLKNYNLLQSTKLNTDTSERKAITAITEKFGGGVGASNAVYPTTTVCIPIPTSLSSAQKVIPLSVLAGGWNISVLLESYAKVFTDGAVGNSYSISDAELVCCMLTPEQSYVQELSAALNKGGSLKIPLQLTKSFTTPLSTSTNQSVRVQCGFLSSLNSITNIVREASVVGQASVNSVQDSFLTNTSSLDEYYIMINSQRYPKNKAIKCGTDPENQYQMLAAFNTKLSSMNPFTTTNAFTHYSFESNGAFAAGIPVADGYISLETVFTTGPTQNDLLDTFLEYSSILVIDANNVQLITDV